MTALLTGVFARVEALGGFTELPTEGGWDKLVVDSSRVKPADASLGEHDVLDGSPLPGEASSSESGSDGEATDID